MDGSSGTYTASNGILYLTQSGEDWEDILYYSVEDNKLYLTPPQDEESGDWGGVFGSEYPMVFERVGSGMPLPAQRLRFVQAIVKTANVSKFVIARPQRGRGNLGKALPMRTSCR